MTPTKDDETAHENEKMVENTIVKYLLSNVYSKRPVKLSDISNIITMKSMKYKMREIMPRITEKMEEIGIQLVSVDNDKAYIMVGLEKPLYDRYSLLSKDETADQVLLYLILTVIFMSDGKMRDEELDHHLKELKILSTGKPHVHEYFGDVPKKITMFVDQLYLATSESDVFENHIEYTWGTRAKLELKKRDVLQFVCSSALSNEEKMENFTSQYHEVLKSEKKIASSEDTVENIRVKFNKLHARRGTPLF